MRSCVNRMSRPDYQILGGGGRGCRRRAVGDFNQFAVFHARAASSRCGWRARPWPRTSACRRAGSARRQAVARRIAARRRARATGRRRRRRRAPAARRAADPPTSSRSARPPRGSARRSAYAWWYSSRSGMRKQNSSPPKRACRSLAPPCAFLGDEVVGAHLLAQQLRHALDDPVADGVAERVVVPLEPGDIDQADRAPRAALLEREERLELLGEPAEVHQLGLGIAVRLVGEVGDQLLEVLRDAADGGVLRRQLALDARHLVGEAGRQRLNGFLLRLLPQPLVPVEDRVDRGQQFALSWGASCRCSPHPAL